MLRMSSSSSDSESSSNFEDLDGIPSDEDENMSTTLVLHEQWVHLIEYCSCQSKSDQSVARNLGVENLCQATDANFGEKHDNKLSWILKKNQNRDESLIVSFETSVFINEIQIYESLNPGSVTKIEMFESQQNKWWIMWQRKTSTQKQSIEHRIFKPLLRRYRHQSNKIRLTFNLNYTDEIGIQAIKLIGSNIFDTNFHMKSLSQSLTKLYEQAMKNINTDIQFRFNENIIGGHRNILSCRSHYFRSLLLNNFIEKTQLKPIELTDINYETFREILHFIYTGTYHSDLSFEIARNAMIYADKINFLTAKNAAMEHICRYLTSNHQLVIDIYLLARKMSPTFDLLLDYVYDLCSENLNEICKQKQFIELDKEFMIDIICQANEKREIREQEKAKQISGLNTTTTNQETEEEEEEEE